MTEEVDRIKGLLKAKIGKTKLAQQHIEVEDRAYTEGTLNGLYLAFDIVGYNDIKGKRCENG